MLSRVVTFFSLLILTVGLAESSFADQASKNTYSVASTGGTSLRKLQCLNQAVNSYSHEFVKQYIKEGDRVLDLGCGPGLMTQDLAKIVGKRGKVVGIDISKQQINIAKKLASRKNIQNIRFKLGSVYDLSKVKGKFDVVYIRFMLINLDNPYEVAEQVKKILKPGGYLLIEEMLGNSVASRPYDYRIELVKKVNKMTDGITKTDFTIATTYSKFLSKNGYTVLEEKTTQPLLDTLSKRRNLSLSMRSMENLLVHNKKVSRSRLRSMIKRVEKMEENKKIELHFYKIGQIAATLT
jgi:ubiquinone/menaquinone biosynthesis C-methylase UbiE